MLYVLGINTLKKGEENCAWTLAWGAWLGQLRKGWGGRGATLLPSCDACGHGGQVQLAKQKAASIHLRWVFFLKGAEGCTFWMLHVYSWQISSCAHSEHPGRLSCGVSEHPVQPEERRWENLFGLQKSLFMWPIYLLSYKGGERQWQLEQSWNVKWGHFQLLPGAQIRKISWKRCPPVQSGR